MPAFVSIKRVRLLSVGGWPVYIFRLHALLLRKVRVTGHGGCYVFSTDVSFREA